MAEEKDIERVEMEREDGDSRIGQLYALVADLRDRVSALETP